MLSAKRAEEFQTRVTCLTKLSGGRLTKQSQIELGVFSMATYNEENVMVIALGVVLANILTSIRLPSINREAGYNINMQRSVSENDESMIKYSYRMLMVNNKL